MRYVLLCLLCLLCTISLAGEFTVKELADKGAKGQLPYKSGKVIGLTTDEAILEVYWVPPNRRGAKYRAAGEKEPVRGVVWLKMRDGKMVPGKVFHTDSTFRVIGTRKWVVDGKTYSVPYLEEVTLEE